jgi:hemerythrin-like domain-containing protein
MSCRICGRSSCTESFHCIEEQEVFNKYYDEALKYDVRDIMGLIQENDELRERITELESENESLEDKLFEARQG